MKASSAERAETQADHSSSTLVRRAGVVALGTLVSRLFGLGRDMTLAAVFSRAQTDAFFVAFTIPNALRQLLGEGAVSSAVVPVLSAKLTKDGDQQAREFFRKIRGLSLVALGIVTALGMLFARELAELFAEGYTADPPQFERTVQLTRWVFPYIFFIGTAALGMAGLHAKRRFAVAAFVPALLNVAFIAAALVLPSRLGARGFDPTLSLAVGALVGGALQAVAQWPALKRVGFGSLPKIDFSDPDVREVVRRITPMLFGAGVYYIDLVLSRRFLSALGEGAQSYFMWAMRVADFPQGIFVMALSAAALPTLSSLAARGDRVELGRTFARGLRLALFVAVPASALLIVLGEPVVVTLFRRGAFDAVSAHETARALAWQGAAVWAVAAVRQWVALLYAVGDTRSPVIISLVDLTVFIGLALGLRGPLGHVGISVAVAGSSFVQMVLLVIVATRRVPEIPLGAVLSSFARLTVAAAVAGAVARVAVGAETEALRFSSGLVGGAVFAIAFIVAAWMVRSPELGELGSVLRRRFGKRAGPS